MSPLPTVPKPLAFRLRCREDGQVLWATAGLGAWLGYESSTPESEIRLSLHWGETGRQWLQSLPLEPEVECLEITLRREDGNLCHALAAGSRVRGAASELDCLFMDVTEQREAIRQASAEAASHAARETQLRENEARLSSLLDAGPDAWVLTNEAGRILMVNHQAENLFGYPRDEMLGRDIEMLMPQRFRHGHLAHRGHYMQRPQLRPMGIGLDLYIQHKNGREIPVEISLSPVQMENQLVIASAIRDVSERRRAQAALKRLHELEMAQAEHLASLGEIATGLAHEIKNPLAAIASALEVLAGQWDLPSSERPILEQVQHQVSRIRGTLDELLNYARPRPLQSTPGDLNLTMEQVVQFLQSQAQAKQIRLNWQPAPLPLLVFDHDQMQRLLMNLLLNAFDAVERKGKVGVSVTINGPGGVEIRVTDNGPGIEPGQQQNIFRPFYTTKGSRGTGLGLSLCRRIAQSHGGDIRVESQPGAGSSFIVRLPLPQEART